MCGDVAWGGLRGAALLEDVLLGMGFKSLCSHPMSSSLCPGLVVEM